MPLRRASQRDPVFVYDISTRLACSTLLFRAQPLDRALDGVKATGIEHVDLWAAPTVLAHVDPAAESAADVQAVLTARGLRASSLTAYATSGDAMRQRISFAGELGARVVIAAAPHRDYDRREAADDVRAYGRTAQEAGVTVCLIHQADTWMDTAEEVASFLDDVGHPRVQLSLDPAQAARDGLTFEALADAAGTRLGHVHLTHAADAGNSDALGDMFDLFEERNYYGMFTFSWQGTDSLPPEEVEASVREARAHVLKVSKAG